MCLMRALKFLLSYSVGKTKRTCAGKQMGLPVGVGKWKEISMVPKRVCTVLR